MKKQALKKSPSKNSTKEQQELILLENMGLVVSLAHSFKPRNALEVDEYIQSGRIGLWKAIKKHDPEKGALSTIAWYYIRWEIIRGMGGSSGKKRPNVKCFTDVSSDFYKIVDDKKALNMLSEIMPNNLTDKENSVLRLRAEGYTMREIGEKFEHSRGWANETFKSAIEKVREG
jgi:RNA polymerase sigma factor (sigma-70 family)